MGSFNLLYDTASIQALFYTKLCLRRISLIKRKKTDYVISASPFLKRQITITIQFFVITNLPTTCEKFLNISIFFYSCGAIEKLFQNSCIVFHQGSQTLKNNKSTRPTPSCLHQFSRVWKP